ncbi:hypothetical protein Tco_0422769 [Tanacetum coccineum]
MAGYKHNQLKSKSYDKIQKLFDKEMKRVNNFVDMNLEVVKGSETRTEESLKISGDELASDKSKKQKIDEHVGAEKDNDPEEEEMKKHMEVVQDEEEIAIDAIPLATKPPMIIEYKIVRRIGPIGYGVLSYSGTVYWGPWVRRISSLGMVFCTSWVRRIELLGYGVLAKSVLFLIFDESIIYNVYTDMDTAYSSKSGNGLLIRQSLGYVV